MEGTAKIQFHYLTGPFYFRERGAVKRFILKQLGKEGKAVEAINYIFCEDDYLLEINRQHLNHDTYTDIITFELSLKGQPLLADIYISIDRVRENAKEFAVAFTKELHRVVFHGALHLCGYKDKSKADSATMRSKEDEWLKTYFVSRETLGS